MERGLQRWDNGKTEGVGSEWRHNTKTVLWARMWLLMMTSWGVTVGAGGQDSKIMAVELVDDFKSPKLQGDLSMSTLNHNRSFPGESNSSRG